MSAVEKLAQAIREGRTHTAHEMDALVLIRGDNLDWITVREDARVGFDRIEFPADGSWIEDRRICRVLAPDRPPLVDPALSPDAARWTPEDDG